MKGTIAILGCLLSFQVILSPCKAEVTYLVHEADFTMPSATGLWDIAMGPDSSIVWASVQDTMGAHSVVSWGSASDSLVHQQILPYSVPKTCRLMWPDSGTVAVCIGFERRIESVRNEISLVGMVLYPNVCEIFMHSWGDSIGDQDGYFWNDRYFHIRDSRPFPNPPNLSQTVGLLSFNRHCYNAQWPMPDCVARINFSRLYIANSTVEESHDTISWESLYGDVWTSQDYDQFTVVAGSFAIYSTDALDRVRRIYLWDCRLDSQVVRSSETVENDVYFRGLPPDYPAFYATYQEPILVHDFGHDLVAWSDIRQSEIWNSPFTTFEKVLIGDIVPDSLSLGQEILGFESSPYYNSILNLESGALWGYVVGVPNECFEERFVPNFAGRLDMFACRVENTIQLYHFDHTVGLDDARPELPSDLTLSAYPNPFNPTTMIAFDLPKAARASLVVYDLNGRLVRTLLDEQMSGGHHEFGFDGATLPSGIYFADCLREI